MTEQQSDLADLVKRAKVAVAHEEDPELRRLAFDRILQHLLEGETSLDALPQRDKPAQKRKGSANRTKRATRARRQSVGPKKWLEGLIDEGFFKQPQPTAAMVKALAERGHHVKRTDLTRQLIALVKEKKLRRKKMRAGKKGREMWHYSKW